MHEDILAEIEAEAKKHFGVCIHRGVMMLIEEALNEERERCARIAEQYVALAEAVRGCDVETVGPNERQPFAGEAITMRYEDWKRVRDALRAIEKAR